MVHRLTASLIELFLPLEDIPRHRVLTALVERLTGFKIVDATEEPFISADMSKKIEKYQPLTSLIHIFKRLVSVTSLY